MAQQKAVEMPVEELEDLVDELEPGTKLLKGQYTITRYLNSGGFGITYLAKDSLDRNVVIKECFPSAFSRRSKTMVAARSRAHTAELRSVIQLFVKEARNLSKIVHPNIVAVHQVFEDNGTAYMAIDFVDGLDLQQIIDGQGPMPTPAEIVTITEKLLHAVGFIHANDMLHRDISPDNVLISKDGEPVLIDFGAAREQASQANRAMSALRVVKDGYSPQEFYIAGSEQGPWSDLYALGATLYHLISGEAPVNGQARLAALAEDRPDPYVKLDGRFDGFPPGFLAAIDAALQTLPKQRVQSAGDWLAMFSQASALASATGTVLPSQEPIDAAVLELIRSERAEAEAVIEAGKTTEAAFGAPPQFARQISKPGPTAAQTGTAASAVPSGGGIGKVQVVAGIAAALAVIAVGLLMMGGRQTPVAAESPRATESSPQPSSEPEATAEAAATAATGSAAPVDAASAAPAEVAQEAVPDASAETVAVAAPDPVATTPEPEATAGAADPLAEPAPAEVAAAPALAAPQGSLRASQVSLAAWDVELPFVEASRVVGNQRVAIVQSVLPGTDLSIYGTWLEPGVRIHSVNGTDVQLAGSVATSILNAMSVDPDGRARVVVEYSSVNQDRQTGLLTVDATRLVSLGNGTSFAVRNIDGAWQTVVTGVTAPAVTELRQDDILYRDQTTGTALDGPDSLEAILSALVASGTSLTEFSILRDNKLETAAMQLATD